MNKQKTGKFVILLVDDEEEYRHVMKIILEKNGYEVLLAPSPKEALEILETQKVDLILSDLKMGELSGMDFLREIKWRGIDTAFIMVTGFGSIDGAVDAIKAGAFSYFIKGSSPEELLKEIAKIQSLSNQQEDQKITGFGAVMTSNNEKMKRIVQLAEKAALSDATILLTGESGVGKEVFARHIHHVGKRKQPMVIVNCGSLPEGVVESELFGHEKGAYTGAFAQRIGKFELANQGTLFLDEIGELTNEIQVKLLRALESKTIERVGSNKGIPIDIRYILATNRKLEKEVTQGTFRKDLLYRINTITIEIPPLRERREDIELLYAHFVKDYQEKYGLVFQGRDQQVEEYLRNHTFPGNIRELRNLIERLVILSDGPLLSGEHLPESYDEYKEGFDVKEEVFGEDKTLRELRKEVEKRYIIELKERYASNLDKVANHLGITKRQLLNKIKEFEIGD